MISKSALDAGLAASAQAVEHYEIARYAAHSFASLCRASRLGSLRAIAATAIVNSTRS